MLTPLDIENREFKKTMGGYNRDDVEDFMSLLLVDYEKLYKENLASRDKITALNEAVEHYKGQEETMQNAILAAQKAADSLAKTGERPGRPDHPRGEGKSGGDYPRGKRRNCKAGVKVCGDETAGREL